MKNPAIFELCAGVAMAQLYERFPVPTNIDFRKLYMEIADSFPDASTEEYVNIYVVIEHMFGWLRREDFVRFDTLTANQVMGAQLTEKGLRALKAVPKDLDIGRQSMGEYLVESLKDGAKDALMKGAVWIVTGGIGS